MSRIGRWLCNSFYVLLIVCTFASHAIADPVIVAQTGANSDLSNSRQIVRTSTGRVYYLSGNAGHTSSWDGWIEVHESGDGSNWTKESTRNQWYLGSDVAVSVDSKNILHVVSYDWEHRPYYVRYNTADSPTANLTWDGYELLETTKTSDKGICAVAVDANGKPHVVFQALESYKGKTYYTLTYANKVGTAWSKVAIWPLTLKTNFNGKIEIAVGSDNIPYIMTGNKMLKGNANAATAFETKDLGSDGTSFVIQQNGDIKVSQISNGNYSINSHDHTLPWSSGWTLAESTTSDSGSTLLLANDTLYAARLRSDGIWLQKNFEPPFLAVSQPANTTWQSLTTRWSSFNHSKQGIIDLGTRSWDAQNGNLFWYSANLADSRANFYGGPFIGVAPLSVSLSDSSIPREGSNIASWQWDFDNDGSADASGPNATHVYSTSGKYSVSLAITDSSGGQDKIVRPDLVQVDGDSDSDGIPDSRDNCPLDYNPLQIDLNGNGIGDACEPQINRLAKSNYMTGLRSITSADSRKATDVTGILTDGLLDQIVTLLPASKDALTVQVNKEAATIKKLVMRYYLNINGNPQNTRVYIMPYNRDLATTVDAGLSGGWNGWNEVDLTPILHRMDGFGLTKFRLVALNDPSGVSIHELNIKETLDNREIAATPAAVDFGSAEVTTSATQDFTISNNGVESLNIVRVKSPSWPFSVVSEDCSGKILASYQTCTIKVSFSPLTNGQYHDAVTIDSNDVDSSSFKVPIQGNGFLVLRGMVKDRATGSLLNAIKVEVTDSVKTYTAITDTNGVYMINGLAAGSYTARFSRADYITYSANGSISQSPNNFLDTQLDFNYASINGIVTDVITGTPLAGAKVTVTLSGISSKDPADKTYTCNGATLAAADYNRIAINDGDKYACSTSYNNSMMFKVRNPNGAEPFTISWNGIGALSPGEILYDPNSMIEYLAQSFKPSKSGKLTRASFYLPQTPCCMEYGGVYVMLKSKLGGDRGTHIAMSNSVRLDSLTVAPSWVDFDFVTPPVLESGQEYYLEINGTFFENYDTLLDLFWSNSDAMSYGYSYRRVGGLWFGSNTLSFRTYLDGQTDIIASPSTSYTGMYGGNKVGLKAYLYGIENAIFPFNQYSDGSDGLSGYNGDDLTGSLTVTDNYANYYDANGRLSVGITSSSVWSDFGLFVFWKNSLVTDQFDITFNRTLTTTTDANGNYSFSLLPGSDYKIQFNKPGYYTSSSGTLAYGEQKNLDAQAVSIPLLNVNITSPLNGSVYYSGLITVSGNVSGNATAVTVNGIAATVANGIFSANIYINNGNNTITAAAIDQYGQEATSSITIVKAATPIISSINTKDITTDSAIITWNTDQPATSVVEFGESTAYGSSITDGVLTTTHSVTITPLKPGTTYHFRVSSKTSYNYSALSGDISFKTLPFSINYLGDSGNVTVMEITGNYDAKNPDGTVNDQPRQAIAKEYFETHDDTDFLVFLSTFDYALPEAGAEGFYLTVKNDTQGINQPFFDNSAQFGSAGKLQGTIDMGNITPLATAPYGSLLDTNVRLLNHELMHRFGPYVRFKNPDGTLNTSLLGKDSAHWSYLLDSKGSLMYGNGWQANQDGTFTATSSTSGFSPLDLYLMGMIPKEQVPPMMLIDNPAIDKTKLPHLGDTITGTTKTVTIDDIIAAEGERIPNAAISPKTFNIGFVLLTRAGDNATAATQAIETLRKAWAGRFTELTQGKGSVANIPASLEIAVDSPVNGATITGPDVTFSGTVINTSGAETGITINGIPATVIGSRFIANHVPLVEGANSIEVKATDANSLTTTTTRSVTASPGNYIRITSNIESGTSPLNISLRLDGSFSIANPTMTASGPVPVTLIPGASSTEFTVSLTVEGTYTFTASAVGPDGQTYTDSVTITVQNQAKIDNLLRTKWNSVNTCLSNGDITKALSFFTASSKDKYSAIFNQLVSTMSSIQATFTEFRTIDVGDGIARYKLIVNEDGKLYAYDIEFLKDETNGLWLLNSY